MECFVIVTVLWVFSVCLHEFGHAWVAYRGGDYTVADKGYLNMNPLRYSHPLYSVFLPVLFMALGGIGLPGGAVYIERSLLRSRGWSTAVSLAGPAMNLALILILGMLFKTGAIPPDRNNILTISFAFLLRLQVTALLLNLVPIPPLDGFQAIAPWLPAAWRDRLSAFSNLGVLILFVAFLAFAPLGRAFNNAEYAVSSLFGVERIWTSLGYKAFKFWDK